MPDEWMAPCLMWRDVHKRAVLNLDNAISRNPPVAEPGVIRTRVDVDSPGFRIPRSFDLMSWGRFSPQEASDERGDPNHSLGSDSVGTSEFRQQMRRWRAGASPSACQLPPSS